MILLHVLSIISTGVLVLFSDEQGLMWMLGKKETLPARRVQFLHRAVSVGLCVIIATGIFMVLSWPSYYLTQLIFQIKMAFVGVLVVNAFFIGALSHLACERTFKSLSAKERIPLLVSGGVSLVGWVGALICGLLLGG